MAEVDTDKKTHIKALNEAYIESTYEVAKKIAEVQQTTDNETLFIGNVRMLGNLNDHA